MTSGEPSRATGIARALALSWFAVALASLSHLAAGGAAPGVTISLAVGALLTLAGMPLCRSAFRLTRHGPLLLLQQLLTHVALSLTSTGHGAPVRPTAQLAAVLDSGHVHPSATHLQQAASTAHPMVSSHTLVPSPLMVLAHLGAALVVAAVLTRAESGSLAVRALVRARARVARNLVTLLARPATAPVLTGLSALVHRLVARADVSAPPPPTLGDLWRSPAPCRRGPPRPCAA